MNKQEKIFLKTIEGKYSASIAKAWKRYSKYVLYARKLASLHQITFRKKEITERKARLSFQKAKDKAQAIYSKSISEYSPALWMEVKRGWKR